MSRPPSLNKQPSYHNSNPPPSVPDRQSHQPYQSHQPQQPHHHNPSPSYNSKPTPVPRTLSKPIRKVDTPDSSSSSEPDNVSTPLNHFVEDDIIVYGTVNGIDTSIIIDSGAKISVVRRFC